MTLHGDQLGEAPGMVGPCAACAGAEGAIHVCEGSGLSVAQQAYEAGAVTPPDPSGIMHTAVLEVRVHGTAQQARELTDAIASRLVEHPAVVGAITVSVR